MTCHLSDATLIYTTNTHGIKNQQILGQDVKLINDVLKKSPYIIKSKTVRRQPDTVGSIIYSWTLFNCDIMCQCDVCKLSCFTHHSVYKYSLKYCAWFDIDEDPCIGNSHEIYC